MQTAHLLTGCCEDKIIMTVCIKCCKIENEGCLTQDHKIMWNQMAVNDAQQQLTTVLVHCKILTFCCVN